MFGTAERIREAGLSMDGAVVAVEGAPGAATTIGRKSGFVTTMAAEAPSLKIAGTQPGNWDQTQATSAAAALFSRYPGENVVAVYSHSDIVLAGALVAAERDGRRPGEDLIAVGVDSTVEGYGNVESGKQYATQLLDASLEGRKTAEITLALLRGEQVEKNTIVETPEITSENLGVCAPAVGR